MRRERKIIGVPVVQQVRSYGLGVDVAKSFHAVCLLVPDGHQVVRWEWETPNTFRSLVAAKRRIQSHIAHLGSSISISYALESTGTYHFPLMRCWGGAPCIVNPGLACSFKARKTDRIDAFKLATQHLSGLWPESFVPDTTTELLRMYTRTRHRLIRHISRLHSSVNTRLWQWACADLKLAAKNPTVRACIEDLACNNYHGDLPQFANHRLVPKDVWTLCIHLYELVDSLRIKIANLEGHILTLCNSDLHNRLQTYPGVGPVTAAIWQAEVEPCTRFATDNQLVGYAGLDPTPQISGGKTVGMRLRQGNKFLRQSLLTAGGCILMGKSLLAQRFAGLTGHLGKRRAVVARYLVRLLRRCSINGDAYDESKVQAAIERQNKRSASSGRAC